MSSGVPNLFNALAVRCCSLSSGFSTSAEANFVGTIPVQRSSHETSDWLAQQLGLAETRPVVITYAAVQFAMH